jgi:hypothetical protein
LAPCSISGYTTSVAPICAASFNGVVPSTVIALTLAPAPKRRRVVSRCPLQAATHNGVHFLASVSQLGSAPWLRTYLTPSTLLLLTVVWRMVQPERLDALSGEFSVAAWTELSLGDSFGATLEELLICIRGVVLGGGCKCLAEPKMYRQP